MCNYYEKSRISWYNFMLMSFHVNLLFLSNDYFYFLCLVWLILYKLYEHLLLCHLHLLIKKLYLVSYSVIKVCIFGFLIEKKYITRYINYLYFINDSNGFNKLICLCIYNDMIWLGIWPKNWGLPFYVAPNKWWLILILFCSYDTLPCRPFGVM